MRKPAFAAIIDEKFDIKIFVDAAVCFETVSGRPSRRAELPGFANSGTDDWRSVTVGAWDLQEHSAEPGISQEWCCLSLSQ
jgi:hypothetical protein